MNPYMRELGLCPDRHIYGPLLRARGLFITPLVTAAEIVYTMVVQRRAISKEQTHDRTEA